MKKMTLTLLIMLGTSTAFSKQLTVVCAKNNPNIEYPAASTLAAVMEIANVNAKPVLQQLIVDGVPLKQGNVTDAVVTKNKVELSLQFGQYLYSSARISLQDCQDSFSATGAAQFSKYTGGFAGTELSDLICTCELK